MSVTRSEPTAVECSRKCFIDNRIPRTQKLWKDWLLLFNEHTSFCVNHNMMMEKRAFSTPPPPPPPLNKRMKVCEGAQQQRQTFLICDLGKLVTGVVLFHFSPKLDHKFMFGTLYAPKWLPAAASSAEVCLMLLHSSRIPRFCSDGP